MAGKRGGGRVFLPKNSARWMLAYFGPKADGRWGEIRESSGTDNREKAEALLAKRRRAALNHRDSGAAFEGSGARRLTVGDLLNSLLADYRAREIKSIDSVLVHMIPVRALLGEDRVLRITPDRIRKYQERRRSDGRANSTVNRETEILSAAFRLAVRERRLAIAPWICTLPENNTRRGFFEQSEIEALLTNLPSPLDDVVRFAYVTGWRRGELLGLRWENVDLAGGEIRLFDSKNGEGRLIPIGDALLAILERRWKAREFTRAGSTALSDVVFHSRGKEIFPTTLGRQWRAACVKAGLGRYVKDKAGVLRYEGKIFHDLRRTAVRNMIRAGVPEAVVMTISGHKTRSMFDRYNITSTDDQRAAFRLLAESLDGKAEDSNVVSFPGGRG